MSFDFVVKTEPFLAIKRVHVVHGIMTYEYYIVFSSKTNCGRRGAHTYAINNFLRS